MILHVFKHVVYTSNNIVSPSLYWWLLNLFRDGSIVNALAGASGQNLIASRETNQPYLIIPFPRYDRFYRYDRHDRYHHEKLHDNSHYNPTITWWSHPPMILSLYGRFLQWKKPRMDGLEGNIMEHPSINGWFGGTSDGNLHIPIK